LLAGTKQARKLLGVATIGFDPVARFAWDERGRDHTALVPQLRQMAIKPVAGWTCLVAEMKLSMAFRQLCRESPHALRVGIDLSPITDLAVPPIFRNCHRVSRFGYI
jgi:hypothetical protein